jgi:hypothetical protein
MNFVLGQCLNVRLFAELNVALEEQLDVIIRVRSAGKDWTKDATEEMMRLTSEACEAKVVT